MPNNDGCVGPDTSYFRDSFFNAAIGMAIAAPDGRYLCVNRALCDVLGFTESELLATSFQQLTFDDDVDTSVGMADKILAGELESYRLEKRYVRRDGRVIWCQVTVSLQRDEEGAPRYFLAQVEDISERKAAELLSRQREQVYRALAQSIPSTAVFLYDHDLRFVVAEGQGLADEGFDAQAVEGKTIGDVLPADRARRLEPQFRAALDGQTQRFEHQVGEKTYQVQIVPVRSDDAILGGLVVSRDVTREKQAEESLRQKAYYDAVTGLPNRMLLQDRLQQALSYARRHETLVGLLFIDLDGFKEVNDRLGHEQGDLALGEVAGVLRGSVRASDTVARWGGDEFLVMLTGMAAPDHAANVAHAVMAKLDSLSLDGLPGFKLRASIGISLFPGDAEGMDDLIRHADEAMYRAKQSGKNRWEFFRSPEDEIAVNRRRRYASRRG